VTRAFDAARDTTIPTEHARVPTFDPLASRVVLAYATLTRPTGRTRLLSTWRVAVAILPPTKGPGSTLRTLRIGGCERVASSSTSRSRFPYHPVRRTR